MALALLILPLSTVLPTVLPTVLQPAIRKRPVRVPTRGGVPPPPGNGFRPRPRVP